MIPYQGYVTWDTNSLRWKIIGFILPSRFGERAIFCIASVEKE